MAAHAIKTPTIAIPFQKLLKVVAIVDAANRDIKQLLDYLAGENYEVEVSDRYERDPSEDAGVGAYIASVDGGNLER